MWLAEQTWPGIEALDKTTPVLVPLAALEQHGRHMPLFTDSLLTEELVRRIEEGLGERVLISPLQWLGNSHHHLDFPGTLSADPRGYIETLNGLLENFIQHEFTRLLLFNGHGGNDVPGKQAVFETRQRHRSRKDLLLLSTTYWHLDARPWERCPELHQRQMGHACEWETSMMLELRPELVRDWGSLPEVPFGNPFEPASRGWTMPDLSVPGHVGSPALATADKGRVLFDAFAGAAITFVERMRGWDGRSWDG